MMLNFDYAEEGLSESDSLGTSSAGSETDPISTLLASMTKDTGSLSLNSAAGGGSVPNNSVAPQPAINTASSAHHHPTFGLAPAPPSAAPNIASDQQRRELFAAAAALQQHVVAASGNAAPPPWPSQLHHSVSASALGSSAGSQQRANGSATPSRVDASMAAALLAHHRASADLTGPQSAAGTPPNSGEMVKCPLCSENFRDPRVLACFHSFCKDCLEKQLDMERIVCPVCFAETKLQSTLGVDGLLSDYGLQNAVHQQLGSPPNSFRRSGSLSSSPGSDNDSEIPRYVACKGCKSGDQATNYCVNCAHHLCIQCTNAHQYMHCFEGHRVEELQQSAPSAAVAALRAMVADKQQCNCLEHRSQPLRFFCLECNFAICKECTMTNHPQPQHTIHPIEDVAEQQMQLLETLVMDATRKQSDVRDMFRLIDACQQRLTASFQRAQNQIDEAAKFLITCIQECQKGLSKDLETTFGSRQLRLAIVDKELLKHAKKTSQTIEFTQRLLKYSSPTEVMVFKPLLDSHLQAFLNLSVDDYAPVLSQLTDIELPNLSYPNARSTLLQLISAMRPESWVSENTANLIGRPPSEHMRSSPTGNAPSNDSAIGSSCQNLGYVGSNGSSASSVPHSAQQHFNPHFGGASAPAASYLRSALESPPSSMQVFNNQYEKWSSGMELGGMAASVGGLDILNNGSGSVGSSDIEDKLQNAQMQLYPPRSQIKRQKMIYHCKFGEFGVMEGQFTEPSGVAVSGQNDIIVADTNNHRIQVFSKDGHFKFQFGECGKRDGQLLYPNRVAVNRTTGDFIVTERSPTHQIQIYNQYGQFLRKFGANILQHPRGVCVDNQGRIIVVECKVMRVIVFDMYGNVLQKFSCSRYLEFPNGVCTNDKNEIFISDNRAHCIKVFNYEGQYLRQIGGEGITNYPIGVGINPFGEVVVADNHNNFNLTIFNQEGSLLSAMESKVKHAQCFDVALLEDGSVVLASKDYRLYLYRYQTNA